MNSLNPHVTGGSGKLCQLSIPWPKAARFNELLRKSLVADTGGAFNKLGDGRSVAVHIETACTNNASCRLARASRQEDKADNHATVLLTREKLTDWNVRFPPVPAISDQTDCGH